jgi:hypothetical protein
MRLLRIPKRIIARIARLIIIPTPKLEVQLPLIFDPEDLELIRSRTHKRGLPSEIPAFAIPSVYVWEPLRTIPQLILILRVADELAYDINSAWGMVYDLWRGGEITTQHFPAGVPLAVP